MGAGTGTPRTPGASLPSFGGFGHIVYVIYNIYIYIYILFWGEFGGLQFWGSFVLFSKEEEGPLREGGFSNLRALG